MFKQDQVRTGWPVCAARDVHVWRVELDCAPNDLIALEAVLSGEERVRALRFATKQLSRRWAAARGALRTILAAYVGRAPESLVLAPDANGKPTLAEINSAPSFNLSHTDHLAFVAVAARGCLGIDAEILRTDIEWGEISRRFFSRAEDHEIKSLAPERRTAAFFACWTRKEAYVKAVGVGLHGGFDRFQVSVRPDEQAGLLQVQGSPDEPRRWKIYDLTEPGVAVALAVRSWAANKVKRYVFSIQGEKHMGYLSE